MTKKCDGLAFEPDKGINFGQDPAVFGGCAPALPGVRPNADVNLVPFNPV